MVVASINDYTFRNGRVQGSAPNQPYGTTTVTSPVVAFNAELGTVTTKSGSIYILGVPHRTFAGSRKEVFDWLATWVK